VQSLWAGVDKLLADPTVPADVPLARMVDPAMNAAMAEAALWAVLHVHRDFVDYARQQRAGQWRQHRQRRADELPVAVLGLGRWAGTVARRLAANGYPVTGWSTRPVSLPGVSTCAGRDALAALLGTAHVVVNLLPLTPDTHAFFDAARSHRCGPAQAS
jgi:glyoxylate/hydroxypyruvate reductase A